MLALACLLGAGCGSAARAGSSAAGLRGAGAAAGVPAPTTRASAGAASAGSTADSSAALPAVAAAVPTLQRPCGTLKGAPRVDKVLLVWEENHSYSSVIGSSSAPEINMLARKCGLATHYRAVDHPSLPNYLQMTSGVPYTGYPWVDDCDPAGACTTTRTSVFSELDAAGKQWRSYVESMGANCGLVSYGNYAAKHNPAAYYTPVRARCRAWDQPLGSLARGALHSALTTGPRVSLTTVTPNVQDDMHDGTVNQADRWLAGWLPQILASPAYRSGRMAVILAWDEGFGSGEQPSDAPLVVMSASTPAGTRSALAFNDYSVLRAVCDLTGVPDIGLSTKAASLVGPFHL